MTSCHPEFFIPPTIPATLASSCRCAFEPVRLSRLVLRNFRNISELTLEPTDILNFLVGENAQGKTSLIEGIYFLSTLRSFRTTRTHDLMAAGSLGTLVEGRVNDREKSR